MKFAVPALLAFLTAGASAAVTAPGHPMPDPRNAAGFRLVLTQIGPTGGSPSAWPASFIVTNCPKAACIRLTGEISVKDNPPVGAMGATFEIPGKSCALVFLNIPHRGMDSPNYRLTLKSRAKKGCASFPKAMQGAYLVPAY